MKLIIEPRYYKDLILNFPGLLMLSLKCRLMNWRLKIDPNKWSKIYTFEYLKKYKNTFSRKWLKISGYETSIRNKEKLGDIKNNVIISNHGSAYEVPMILEFIDTPLIFTPNISFYKWWLTGPMLKTMNCVPIDKSSKHKTALSLFKLAKGFKKNGTPIVFFPEGGTSKGKNMSPFKEEVIKFIMNLKADITLVKVKYKKNKQNPDGSKNNKMELIICDKVKYHSYKKKKVSQLTQELWNVINKTI